VQSTTYRVAGIEVQPSQRCIVRDGRPVYPRAKTFQLLLYLLERPNQLVTKEELLENLWADTAVTDNSLVQCVIELRKALGDEARSPRFIKTIPKGGYQFIAPVEDGDAAGAEMEEVTTVELEYVEEDGPKRSLPLPRADRKTVLVLAGSLAAACCLALLGPRLWNRGAEVVLPHVSGKTPVVVMRFDNESASADLDWLRAGLGDMLITNLSRSPRLNVLSRRQFDTLLDREGLGSRSATRLEDALRIARKTHADVVLLGTFGRLGEKIRIGAELHEAAHGKLIAADSVTADRADQILGQVDLLSLRIASRLGSPLSAQEGRAGLSVRMTNHLEAYRDYSVALEEAQAYHSQEAIALL